MRIIELDGRPVALYEPDEIGSTPAAPTNSRHATALHILQSLMEGYPSTGPLLAACKREAERVSFGGTSPATLRRHRQYVLALARARVLSAQVGTMKGELDAAPQDGAAHGSNAFR